MNQKKILAIVKKELGHYFSSPVGYVVLFVFVLLGGVFFSANILNYHRADMMVLYTMTFICCMSMAPFMTMRLWSEEEKNGTAELLKTSPLTVWQIVIGKYLGVCAFFFVTLAATLIYLVIIIATGNPDLPPVLASYLGYVLAAMAFFSIGLLASTLSENQIVSAVISFVVLFLFWIIGFIGGDIEGKFGELFKYISITNHLDDFIAKGVIDLSHVFYFASVIFLGLFFSVKVLEGKRN